jgi:four helix bundle protein
VESLRHHNLAAWKYSDEFFFEVHRLVVERFPRSDRYELGSQLRRAALSVPAIVEGLARRTQAEQSQFLRTAWSSLLEADYYLSVARRLQYLNEAEHRTVDQMARRAAAALAGLMKSVRNQQACPSR